MTFITAATVALLGCTFLVTAIALAPFVFLGIAMVCAWIRAERR